MSTEAYLDVFGAGSARQVAELFAGELNAPAALEGTTDTGESWAIAAPDWRVDVYEQLDVRLQPGEGPIFASVQHVGPDPEPMHRIADRLYRRIVANTAWGVTAESEADGFPARSRTAS